MVENRTQTLMEWAEKVKREIQALERDARTEVSRITDEPYEFPAYEDLVDPEKAYAAMVESAQHIRKVDKMIARLTISCMSLRTARLGAINADYSLVKSVSDEMVNLRTRLEAYLEVLRFYRQGYEVQHKVINAVQFMLNRFSGSL